MDTTNNEDPAAMSRESRRRNADNQARALCASLDAWGRDIVDLQARESFSIDRIADSTTTKEQREFWTMNLQRNISAQARAITTMATIVAEILAYWGDLNDARRDACMAAIRATFDATLTEITVTA